MQFYQNNAFGVSFNINDNLSISYGEYESTRQTKASALGGGEVESQPASTEVTTTVDSIQIAYTMGGMSIKIAETDLDNSTYTSGSGSDFEATTVALTLAF